VNRRGSKSQRKTSKKSTDASRGANSPPTASQPPESQSAEAVTVGWMLSALAAVAAQAVGIALQLALRSRSELQWLQVPARTILFVAFVAGVATLALTPLVLKLRRAAPPRPILLAALVAGAMPLLTMFLKP
jgi:hypothetical protein